MDSAVIDFSEVAVGGNSGIGFVNRALSTIGGHNVVVATIAIIQREAWVDTNRTAIGAKYVFAGKAL